MKSSKETFEDVLALIRCKKLVVTRIGTPVAVNKGKLLDELIGDIQKLQARAAPKLTIVDPIPVRAFVPHPTQFGVTPAPEQERPSCPNS